MFLCMSPLSKVETRSDSSLHNIVENIINIIPYQIARFVSKNLITIGCINLYWLKNHAVTHIYIENFPTAHRMNLAFVGVTGAMV